MIQLSMFILRLRTRQGGANHGLGRLENNGRVCEGSWARINGKLIGVGIISSPSGVSYQVQERV
jgi:hypothetical protein